MCPCGVALTGQQKLYCSRRCKNRASDKRRYERDPGRDRRRYAAGEAAHRKAVAKAYYYANQEQQQLYSRNYRASNKAVRRAQHARRSQLIAASDPIPISAKDWRRLCSRFRGCCAYCQKPCASLQMDHVIPIARGGRHAPANILPACPPCNISKRDHLLSEWRLSTDRG